MSALFWILLLIVLVAVFGGAIFSVGWWLLWTVLIGLVIGLLGRVLVRNTGGLGAGPTILAGIAGSIVGGWIAYWLDLGGLVQFVVAILAAAVFIGVGTAGSTNAD
jgi:uncharacterized membrane protein YeaQ/YmgE (transglycosylase-associated protein family)